MFRFPAHPRHSRSAERALGRHTVWGKEGILPPASPRLGRARPTGSANPLSRFHIGYVVSLSLLDFSIARLRRRSSFSHGRPSGNVRGSNPYCTLDPPSRSRVRTTPLARTRGVRAGLPLNKHLNQIRTNDWQD